MISKPRCAILLGLLLAIGILALNGGQHNVIAADATPAPAAPPPAAVTEVPPDTLPGVIAKINEIQAQIKKLEEQIDQMISVADIDQKKRLRDQVKSLKTQVKILEHRREQLELASSQSGIVAIREQYRQKIKDLEARKTAIRRETINRFEGMLAANPNSQLAPDILWRLGNLYFEEAHAQYLDAWDSYESKADQLYNQGAVNVVPEAPRHNYQKSIDLMKKILKDYPTFEKKEDVLYLLAYCYQEQKDDDNALLVYDRLIKEAPEGAKVPESYVRMGEIYFDREQYDKAIDRYRRVLEYKQSKFYDKALYKLGWCYYKQNNFESSVQYFTEVLKYYKNRPEAQKRKRAADDLRKESVDYIAISFTEAEGTNGAAAAIQFMNKIGDRDIGREILLKVGEVFDERTDYEPARETYKAYLNQFPLAPDVPEVYRKIAVSYEKQARFDEAVAVYTEIGEKLGPNSPWANANIKEKADLASAAKLRQSSIIAAATFNHEKAQTSSGAESQAYYAKAIENYQIYLKNFPDTENYYETAFNLGECYFETKQYMKAADKYQEVIKLKKDKDLWTKALFNNTKAYEQQLEIEGGLPNKEALSGDKTVSAGSEDAEGGQRKGVQIKKTPLSPTAGKWIEALKQYIDNLPDSDKSPVMLYKIGEIYYVHGDFITARQYFEQVFAKYPKDKVVQYAAYYQLETYKQSGDYAGMRDAVNKIPTETGGIEPEKRVTITAGATFKIAEQLLRDATSASPVDKRKVQEAINEYLTGIRQNPNDKFADVAMLNVAVAYENHLQDLTRANEMYSRLATAYPKSSHAPESLLKSAYNYQILVEFDAAMSAYEQFVRQWPDNKETGNALFNAAALNEESGRYAQAITLYQQYLNKYATATDAPQTAFKIAKLYDKLGDVSGAMAAYESYAKRGPDDAARMSEAYFRWGKMLEDRGNFKEAQNHYLQAIAVFQKAKEVDPQTESRYAAEAQFRITDNAYNLYKAEKFTGNIKKDAAILQSKAEAFKKLKEQYELIVTFGNYHWATASLHMIGVINQDFSESLLTAPVPKDLPQEQQDEYIFKLEEIAFPIKNRALEAFKQNVTKGINERLINEWIVKSYQELKKLEPATKEPKFELVNGGDSPAFVISDIETSWPEPAPPPPSPSLAPPAPGGATPPPPGGKKIQWFFDFLPEVLQ